MWLIADISHLDNNSLTLLVKHLKGNEIYHSDIKSMSQRHYKDETSTCDKKELHQIMFSIFLWLLKLHLVSSKNNCRFIWRLVVTYSYMVVLALLVKVVVLAMTNPGDFWKGSLLNGDRFGCRHLTVSSWLQQYRCS